MGRAIMGITPSVEKEDVSLDRAVSLGAERCVYILKIMVAGLADILAGAAIGIMCGVLANLTVRKLILKKTLKG